MAHRSAPPANVARAAATIAMPSRENMFHVEKHANDVLHNAPRRRGRTHTDVEIAAASMVLGRSAPAPAPASARARAPTTSTRVIDGAVVRIDAESLATGTGRCSTSEALRASGALGARGLKNATTSLTEDKRWKTKDRILAGGTGGAAQLRAARRAALGLSGGKCDADEDAPVVVPVEDLTFVDGWAGCDSARAPSPVAAIVEKIMERARGSAVEVATIGRKRKKAHRSTSRVASNAGCLSFDVDEE